MSENASSSRSIMIAAIAAAVLLVIVAIPLSGIGKGARPAADDAVAARIAPVAQFDLKLAAAGGGGPKTADSIYNGVCSACHGTGAAGAPKKGDKAAWGPRLKAGIDALVKSAVAGKGAMPPKGGAGDLTDAEIKSVIELMTK